MAGAKRRDCDQEAAVYEKIIAGYGWSAQADDSIALAGRLAEETGAAVLVATVWHRQIYRTRVGAAGFDRWLREDARVHSEEGARKLPAGVEGTPVAVHGTSAAAGLHDLAEQEDADLLVIGSTAHGPIDRIIVGSTGASSWSRRPAPLSSPHAGSPPHREARRASSPWPTTARLRRRRPCATRARWRRRAGRTCACSRSSSPRPSHVSARDLRRVHLQGHPR
jgi:nucleotide-binding universal stress UspA family protein